MKRYNDRQRTGHLLAFVAPHDAKDNFSIFFPVAGLNDFDNLYKVVEGFQRCHKENKHSAAYDFQGHAVNDSDHIRDNFPEFDKERLCCLELLQFIDEKGIFVNEFADTLMNWFACKTNIGLPSLRTGSIATGTSFFDREKEKENIWKEVSGGKSVLLQSPRRYGKTSLLKHIEQNHPSNWNVCYVDLQGGKSVSDFLEILVGALMLSEECASCLPHEVAENKPWQMLSHERSKLRREEREEIQKDWKKYGSRLFAEMDKDGKKTLLIFDEFSYMLEDMLVSSTAGNEVEELMEWFAGVRRETNHVFFILSGSEHLQTFLKRHDINGKIEDLAPVTLGLFSNETALSLMLLLFIREEISVEKSELDAILSLMGAPIPYFLQVFVDLLGSECRRREELTLFDIENLYDTQLLGPDSKRYFESLAQQLDRYGQLDQHGSKDAAKKVLNYLATMQTEKVGREDLESIWTAYGGSTKNFADVLDLMKDDFYIDVDSHNRVTMISKLIRDWWAKYAQE